MVSKFELIDIDSINVLGKELNPNFTKLFHIDNLNDNEIIYVYKEKEKVLGFIHIAINYEIVDILNLVVMQKERNKKIASILMDYMITDLPKSVNRILLEVNEENCIAIRFYIKFNFQIISKRKNYYNNKDAIIMERKIK